MRDIQVVIDAESGETLLAGLLCTDVDVVVIDVRMPRLSGIEVVPQMRRAGDHTPALMLTTFNEPKEVDRAANAGANGFLLKGVEYRRKFGEFHGGTQRLNNWVWLGPTISIRTSSFAATREIHGPA